MTLLATTLGLVWVTTDSTTLKRESAGMRPPARVEANLPPELIHLAPGMRFRPERAPDGWQVVLRSTPNLAAGALDTLSDDAHKTAGRIRLTVMAGVEESSPGGPKVLRRVGVSLSAPVPGAKDEDVTVSATNVGDSSGEWSTKERIILAAGSRELGKATLRAATPTFALLSTPTTCLVDGRHEEVDVMYAIVLQPQSGQLRLFACKPRPAAVIRELTVPAVVEGPLHVQVKSFAGIPVSWSFAMVDVPDGVERAIPGSLTRLIAPEVAATADARVLERAFRELGGRPAATPTARADSPTDQGF